MSEVCGLPIVDMPTEGVSTVEALGMVALADVRLRGALDSDDRDED